MKYFIQTILLLFSFTSFSQSKKPTDPIKKVFASDIVEFYADNSGCFQQESVEYKFVKEKNGMRSVMFMKDGKMKIKKISSKNYTAFIKNFTDSYNKFKDPDKIKQTCTSTSEFSITHQHKDPVSFKNVTCEADFNPEMFLMQLIK